MIWKIKIHHPLLMRACMDGDVRYVEEYILPTYLCALIAVIII